MHKSKNYDMATQVAMDKLMPKPIQITISMQGGGGLRGLGDRPLTSVYGRPIPRTIYRQYGGGAEFGMVGDEIVGAESWDYPENIDDGNARQSVIEKVNKGSTWKNFTPREKDIYGKQIYPLEKNQFTTPIPGIWDYHTGAIPRQGSQLPPGRRGDYDLEKYEEYRNQMGITSLPKAIGRIQPDINVFGMRFNDIKRELHNQETKDWYDRETKIHEQHDKGLISDSELLDFKELLGKEGEPEAIEKKAEQKAREIINRRNPKSGPRGISNPNAGFRAAASGGGIASLKKSININGQPHKLAWIRPDEASALKAMGGSGKKVEGIPAYFWGEDTSNYAEVTEDISSMADPSLSEYTHTPTPTHGGDPHITYGPTTSETVTTTTTDKTSDDTEYTGVTGKELGDVAPTQSTKDTSAATHDLGKGLMGEQYDFNSVKNLWTTQWIKANPGGRRDPRTQEAIDIEDDWQKAVKAPGGLAALAAGFKVGDPYGNQIRESFNTIQKQLKKKFKSETDKKSVGQDDEEPAEMTREELSALVKDIDGLEDFTPYSGIDYPAWLPGGMAGKAIDFLSRTVIGTGTVGGVGVHIHKDGSVTPVSPEDSRGFDHEAMKGENVEAPRRRRRGPPPPAPAATLPPEDAAPAKGTMAELLSRQGPTDRLAGIRNLEDILASTHPGIDFNIG